MNRVKIMTDSTCDLSEELLKTNDISVVPLYVHFGEESYRDGIDIRAEGLYKLVEEYKTLPKTSAPSPGDFIREFEQYIKSGEDILYIGLSSQMSSTLQNAKIAAAEFPEDRIKVVDSKNLSTGIGLLVMKAVDCASEGMALNEIAAAMSETTAKVKTRFIISTLDYLYKGGRCSALESFIGGLLSIKPVVTVRDGKMVLEEKIRGKREKALSNMLDNALQDAGRMDEKRIFITHSMALEEAVYLKQELEKELKKPELIIADAGCVISSHCGPGTVGILYIRNN